VETILALARYAKEQIGLGRAEKSQVSHAEPGSSSTEAEKVARIRILNGKLLTPPDDPRYYKCRGRTRARDAYEPCQHTCLLLQGGHPVNAEFVSDFFFSFFCTVRGVRFVLL
jgi:hypothetical protein